MSPDQAAGKPGVEQVPLERLLDSSCEVFDKSLLSINARIVLWGSIESDESLLRNFLQRRGRANLLDGRRKLTASELEYKEQLDLAAQEAMQYVQWIREHRGQPLAHDALIAYCAAFENCLKSIAVVFRLAGSAGKLDRVVYVPGPDLTRAWREVGDAWQSWRRDEDDHSRVKTFYEDHLVARNPCAEDIRLEMAKSEVWDTCSAAFELRNAILHSAARLSRQVLIDSEVFHPG